MASRFGQRASSRLAIKSSRKLRATTLSTLEMVWSYGRQCSKCCFRLNTPELACTSGWNTAVVNLITGHASGYLQGGPWAPVVKPTFEAMHAHAGFGRAPVRDLDVELEDATRVEAASHEHDPVPYWSPTI